VVDPILVGALLWLGDRLGGRAVDKLFDSAFDQPAGNARPELPAVRARRHDLTVAGAQGTSDVDITVRHHLARTRVPVILTFQKFQDSSTGTTFLMVLGDTAQVTLPRNDYLVTALIIDPPPTAAAKPTLHGLGWVRRWVAGNDTEKITITTAHPTDELVEKIGLKKPDGSLLFTIPPKPPPRTSANTTTPRIGTNYTPSRFVGGTRWQLGAPDAAEKPPFLSDKIRPLPEPKPELRRFFGTDRKLGTPDTFGKFRPLPKKTSDPAMCRAQSWVGDGQCEFVAGQDKLCGIHRKQVKNGSDVRDYVTGERILPT
jgi:hypothetical protein